MHLSREQKCHPGTGVNIRHSVISVFGQFYLFAESFFFKIIEQIQLLQTTVYIHVIAHYYLDYYLKFVYNQNLKSGMRDVQ